MGSSSSKPVWTEHQTRQQEADDRWRREMGMHRGYTKREQQVSKSRKARDEDARHEAMLMRTNGAQRSHVYNHQRVNQGFPQAVNVMYSEHIGSKQADLQRRKQADPHLRAHARQRESEPQAQGKQWRRELEMARSQTNRREEEQRLQAREREQEAKRRTEHEARRREQEAKWRAQEMKRRAAQDAYEAKVYAPRKQVRKRKSDDSDYAVSPRNMTGQTFFWA
ncbi:MAG: hypothetical protein M1828_004473 [Chrysothrix sp. TS-e1954]|nr:MAG: hypothetical protein M1828_004473 [Chrysothrix sp. TS-e1954]